MFRGKESSNRIELSRLVQDIEFWCFALPAALGVGGWVDGGGGWLGGAPHTCAHARMHTHAHACVVNMIIPCKWLLPLDFGEIPGIPYDVIHACACMRMRACACMCMCVGGILSPPLTPIHPPPHPLGWGTPGISQNSIALELIEIFQFCLKI